MASVSQGALFDPVQLTTSLATVYTLPSTPANISLVGGKLLLTNTSAGAQTFTIHAIPSGGSAGDTNTVVKDQSLAASAQVAVLLPRMGAGDFIQAKASAATSISLFDLGGALVSP